MVYSVKKLKLNIRRSGICQVIWNGKEGFEVQEGSRRRFTVNLETWKCSCRYWKLSGLPCWHAFSAIYTCSRQIDDFIAPCYTISEYNKIYDHVLQPVEGKESWPVANNPKPHPPPHRVLPGSRQKEEEKKARNLRGTSFQRNALESHFLFVGAFDITKENVKGIRTGLTNRMLATQKQQREQGRSSKKTHKIAHR